MGPSLAGGDTAIDVAPVAAPVDEELVLAPATIKTEKFQRASARDENWTTPLTLLHHPLTLAA